MRRFTDEEIMAYADGEATPEQARAIAEAARTDPAVASRVAQFEDTRRVLKEAFARSLSEPVPERLRKAVGAGKGNGAGAAEKAVPTAWRGAANAPSWVPMALAASVTLAVGLAVGDWLGRRGAGAGAEMVASAAVDPVTLARALEGSESGVAIAADVGKRHFEVLPTSTLRTADGGFCREFESSVDDASGHREARGLACRDEGGRWETQAIAALSDAADADEGYRPASGGGVDFAAGLRAQQLTPEQERGMIAKRWGK